MNNNDIQGSLSVSQDTTIGGNLAVRGTSTFDHNVKIKGWIDAKNIKGPLKGLFKSEDELKLAYPKPQPGWFALVGNTLPAEVYRVENGEWADTGEQGGGVYLSLDGMEEDINNAQNDILELQTLVSDGVLVAGSVVISSDATTATMTYRLKKRDGSTKDYTVTVPIASESSAGMMSAADKKMITTTVNLTDLDFDLSMIGKIVTANSSCRFIVMSNGKNVGILHCFSDDSQHMLTQVFTTHYLLPFSNNTHSDEKIFTYFRSYHLSGGTSSIPTGTWGEWTLVYSSDNQKDADALKTSVNNLNANTGIDEYETFSEAKEYPAGYTLLKDGLLYTFITDHAVGAWNGSEVVNLQLGIKINDIIKEFYCSKTTPNINSVCKIRIINSPDGHKQLFLYDKSNNSIDGVTIEDNPDVIPYGAYKGQNEVYYYIENWHLLPVADVETLSKILCKCKQDSVVSSFLYLDSVFKNEYKLIHNQSPVMNRLCPFLLNLHN